MLKYLAIFTFVLASAITVSAQSTTLSGTVTADVTGDPVPGVRVEITRINRSTETDEDGRYTFENVPAGSYTVVTHIEGFADKAQPVRVLGGGSTLDFVISLRSINAEVTVTATGEEESVYESFSSVNSVGITNIAKNASIGLGDVLESEAGVSNRSFGSSGTSRPSIRGFEGDRVLILQDGIRNGSIGSTSGDHGEPVSPFGLERIEVIKGPATLLYGSNAIGGVVNAVSDDEDEAHEGFRGYFTGFAGSVDKQGGLAGGIEVGSGNNLFNFDTNFTREGDFETPLGKIPNSGGRSWGVTPKYGYFGENGFFRASVSVDRRRYGIPYAPLFESGELLSIINDGKDCGGGHHKDEGKGEPDCVFDIEELKSIFADQLPPIPEEEIDIKMQRNNYRFSGGFRDIDSPITAGTFTVDFTDYQHEEIESEDGEDEVATTFENDVFSYRAVLRQRNYKNLSGQFGFEGYRRSFETVGAESLVEGRVRQNNFAGFVLQELSFDKVALQFGGRIESNSYKPVNTELPELDFTGFSGSIGARFEPWEGGSLIASFSTSFRSPALEELYNFGPHIGTVTFEIGDTTLDNERSNGFEFSFRQNSRRVRFNGSFFYNDISDFIFQAPLDDDGDGNIDVDDGLPVAFFTQGDARYYGADASLEVDANDNFGVFVAADIVNAELKDFGFSPPRITPARFRAGVDFRYGGLSVRPEGVFVGGRESEIFPLETSTDGYALFNVNGSYTFVVDRTAHIITFGAQNLTDKLYRNHVNFLKDIVPERGRGVKVSYTVRLF
ncbi:MAG: TonB-dependent receptor [Acidobacteria bacterium]|nr:MAG: TonB-dependent receptor [Acidobacteriota bacterium]REK03990.1 MAG: TonB-dependent receptor [Acidobacteriota bacterium]REK15152.1 MAG: TonB-dependent receptor [Acidobacteriota bacterium]REK46242.1 MAG: TonB-dependent receptor [Acidobacteriota bacterium]